jgi:hypothetical protein
MRWQQLEIWASFHLHSQQFQEVIEETNEQSMEITTKAIKQIGSLIHRKLGSTSDSVYGALGS